MVDWIWRGVGGRERFEEKEIIGMVVIKLVLPYYIFNS